MNHLNLLERLRRVESPNLVPSHETLFWSRALGSEVWDAEGKKYIDFSSGFGAASVGFSHPLLVSKIKTQSESLIHGLGDVYSSLPKLELMESIERLLGFSAKGILSSTGTEAVESSLKTAKIYTGKPRVIVFEGAYHGLGYGVLRSAGRKDFSELFLDQTADIFFRAPFPDNNKNLFNEVLAVIEKEFKRNDVGAVLLEPIQGRGGIRPFPDGFISELSKCVHDSGALLILDEVMTGFGRTGSLFAFQNEGIEPDVIALGKGMAGGLPISASFARAEIMDSWPKQELDSIHTSTFLGNPLCSAAALEVIGIIQKEKLHISAREKGKVIFDFLSDAVRENGWTLRGRGLMLGIDCKNSRDALRSAKIALDNGLIILLDGLVHETIVLLPALNISDKLLKEGLEILRDAIKQTSR